MRPLPNQPIAITVVGVTFVPSYPNNVLAVERSIFEEGECPVYCMRERDNPEDPNAVRVIALPKSPAHERWVLGHIPRDVAARMAPEMDANGTGWRGWVEQVRSRTMERPGVSIIVERYMPRPDVVPSTVP